MVCMLSVKLVWQPYFVCLYPYILLGFNYIPLLSLKYHVLLNENILKMANDILFSLSYHIDSRLNFCNKYRALFNSSQWIMSLSISFYVCNKDYFVVIVLISTASLYMRDRTIFWSCWIDPFLSTSLLLFPFSI